MTTKQQTIQKSVSVTGHGLHTGKDVTITFNPAAENHGIIFKRIDLEGAPEIKLSPAAVFDTSRGTSIKSGNAEVRTIEHVLSAINGLQIDNLLVEINCEETPIMDGSAMLYVKALKEAGIVEQEADRNYFAITENITYRDEENGVELIALPADDFRVSVLIDYNSDVLPAQHAELKNIDAYENEIAPCRTFVF
ncbi:MAG: UDP-3-O-acyl-N-acetylglucosamine deacetylase, partial [Bacteroidales bacterium]|nr:UDP-3-O-acyl-N-acetylglucosamine deacetylase [Bacteroidales bacterium]